MKTSAAALNLFKARHSLRSDTSYYKYLLPSDTFANASHLLHPMLQEGLAENSYTHLSTL